jgi:hypothetical protein
MDVVAAEGPRRGAALGLQRCLANSGNSRPGSKAAEGGEEEGLLYQLRLVKPLKGPNYLEAAAP